MLHMKSHPHTALCQNFKTTLLTGHDRLIQHSLDAITINIPIQDLFLVQLFAQIAAKICFQNTTSWTSTKTFSSLTLTTSSHRSACLQPCLNIVCLVFNTCIHNQPLASHLDCWVMQAQMCCGRIVELDQAKEDAESLQAEHTCAMENTIYVLSMHSLAGAAEDVLPLFLKANTLWPEHCQ